MSDVERLNLRDLPAVPAIEGFPDRYSQTLLRHADACMRSAYLYVKYRGGMPGHELDRGAAAHAVFERLTWTLLEHGEETLFAAGATQGPGGELVGEDALKAAQEVASLSAAVVDEVLRERPDLPLPVGEADAVRVMAYHWAVATVIDPAKVVAVERKFLLDVGGHEVSGIVDLATLDGHTAEIVDYKTSFNVPEEDEYRKSFQPRLYAAAICFGVPVAKVPCSACPLKSGVVVSDCEECGGRGYVERREDPIGERIAWVKTREVYPRYLLDSGHLRERDHVLSRTDVADFLSDLERLIERVDGARGSGKWPAVAGSHCSECPAAPECPLPPQLRNYAGAINVMDQASEAAQWADVMGDRVAAVNKELKRFAGAHGGRVRYGADLVREFSTTEGRAVRKVRGRSDWDGLQEAVQRAVHFGEPFELGEWVRSTASTQFKRRTLTAEELDAERRDYAMEVTDGDDGEDRFGVDPPF